MDVNSCSTINYINNELTKLNANNTIPIVKNIDSIPPRVSNASTSSIPVSETYPPYNTPMISPNERTSLKNEIMIAAKEPIANDKMAGIFRIEQMINTAIGMTPAYQLTSPVSSNPA